MLSAQRAYARDWQHLARIAEIGGAPRRSPDGRLFYASRVGERDDFDAAFSKSIDRVSRCTRVIPTEFDRSIDWQLRVAGRAFSAGGGAVAWSYASWARDIIELHGEACDLAIEDPDSVLLVADSRRCSS
ncbi:MAG: hypothetical protein JNK05_25105 [Myxococcales bacterium]|nr:hypothetical protein [Myxococcales bacterium]